MNIVITGSTRGLGFSMAKQFLENGHRVLINGTSEKTIDIAKEKLKNFEKAFYFKANIENFKEISKLFDYSKSVLGEIDIWINNAGINQNDKNFDEINKDDIEKLISVNLIGLMYGCSLLLKYMKKRNSGAIYNMEGLGSNGMIIPKTILYATTKSALTYFTKGLQKENKDNNVIIGRISPGMVLTDFLLNGVENEKKEKTFRILADKPDKIAKFIVEKIVKNKKKKPHIVWLTSLKISFRFLSGRFWVK